MVKLRYRWFYLVTDNVIDGVHLVTELEGHRGLHMVIEG